MFASVRSNCEDIENQDLAHSILFNTPNGVRRHIVIRYDNLIGESFVGRVSSSKS